MSKQMIKFVEINVVSFVLSLAASLLYVGMFQK